MIISTKRKNVLTKTQLDTLFDNILKEHLKTLSYENIFDYKIPSIAIVYDKKQQVTCCLGKDVNEKLAPITVLNTEFVSNVAREVVTAKGRNMSIKLDELNDLFNSLILNEFQKHVKVYKFERKIRFQTKERLVIFKGVVGSGKTHIKKTQTQDTIRKYIQENNPKGYEILMNEYKTIEKINRVIGYLIVDIMRSGMAGIQLLGQAQYYLDFEEVNFEFDKNVVQMSSTQPFTKQSGTQFNSNRGTGFGRERKTTKNIIPIDSHPLAKTFDEVGLDKKFLPQNKSDKNKVINIAARKLKMQDLNKLRQAMNDW